jgi:hypothetical protein
MIIDNDFPPPQTQIPVYDDYGGLVAELDMGWQDMMIALDYEGEIVARLTTVWRQRRCALGENPDAGPPWAHVRRAEAAA